ncbi:MAG: undecaprenyldiphospho-muramoylpentapeptide beta-N-acetylglucosaminyltransferase [Patescibacteria group bacterium]
MRFLIAGGGTGGHVYPGVTIGQTIKDKLPGADVVFVGTRGGLEADVVPKEGFPLETIPLIGLPRRLSFRLFKALGLAAAGVLEARRIIGRFKPDVVIGTGGYVCGPVILAAWSLGVPAAIQEQNAIPGLTNRILGRLVGRIFLGYGDAGRYFNRRKIMVTGNPIRASVLDAVRAEGAARLGLEPGLTTILVMGASQGAHSINQALLACLPSLLRQPRLQVLHVTGKRHYEAVIEAMKRLHLAPGMAARAHTEPYLYRIADAYAAADLVVARSGAISLAEMTARGLPMILVPFPYATADHQTYNARALARRGAARIIPDRELTGERLLAEVLPLLRDPAVLAEMRRASLAASRPDAARDIVVELIAMAGGRP